MYFIFYNDFGFASFLSSSFFSKSIECTHDDAIDFIN